MSESKSPKKARRIRDRLFAEVATFSTKGRGFVPLPILLRPALHLFDPRAWMVLTDIYMRCGPEFVCWFTLAELGHDMAFASVSKLKPYVDQLIEKGFVMRTTDRGVDYYCAVDPRKALADLIRNGKIHPNRVAELDELAEALGQERLSSGVVGSEPGAAGSTS